MFRRAAQFRRKFSQFTSAALISVLVLSLLTACSDIKSPKPEVFIGENTPPPKQEFRWSNGKAAKTLDPAQAAASPESDVVRAIYEGLTNFDSKTSQTIPSVAAKWTSSADLKVWTFELRHDAKWSNGENVTAQDFVRSWKRLAELGSKVSQRSMMKNIVGMDSEDVLPIFANDDTEESEAPEILENSITQIPSANSNSNSAPIDLQPQDTGNTKTPSADIFKKTESKPKGKGKFGVEAIDKFILKVTLNRPDKDLPLLVSHPIFRPVYDDGNDFEKLGISEKVVTNGAFKIVAVGKEGITLERNPLYWNQHEIKLDRVKFVPAESAEQALAAYRSGEIDAVTNANFEPLALKLLKPFEEFHKTTHGALNYYEFNLNEKPFDDLRVRKALAISIERERLTEDEMDGATEPALKFLPFESAKNSIDEDVGKARKLMAEAGFENGVNFPTVKLLVNRNNTQQKIARSIAKMWLKNLNIKTEVVIKEREDFENSVQTGDFSLARRGVVLPTHDEMINIMAMFDRQLPEINLPGKADPNANSNVSKTEIPEETPDSNSNVSAEQSSVDPVQTSVSTQFAANENVTTQEQALEQLPAIPLYFPNSYSLVKPYIKGFELNAFDALSLKNVEIDSNWQPSKKATPKTVPGQ